MEAVGTGGGGGGGVCATGVLLGQPESRATSAAVNKSCRDAPGEPRRVGVGRIHKKGLDAVIRKIPRRSLDGESV